MRNTIRKVIIVVPVLMISCQVSENPKSDPETAHKTTRPIAIAKTHGVPAHRAIHSDSKRNFSSMNISCVTPLPSHSGEGGAIADKASRVPQGLHAGSAGLCHNTDVPVLQWPVFRS